VEGRLKFETETTNVKELSAYIYQAAIPLMFLAESDAQEYS